METLTLVCYDLPDDRRRNRLARLLEGYGQRVQRSVFECWLTPSQWPTLQRRVAQCIDPATDQVRYYRLCGKDAGACLHDGTAQPATLPDHFSIG